MKRINKKNIFITSVFTLLTTGLPGLFFNSAYATSVYDDAYKTTDELILQRTLGNCNSVGAIDITTTWQDIVSNPNSWGFGVGTVFNKAQATIHDGGSFTISNYRGSGYGYVTIYGDTDSNIPLNWGSDYVTVGGFEFELQISLEDNGTSCDIVVYDGIGSSLMVSATDTYTPGHTIRNFLSANVTPYYPTGYAGTLLKDGTNDDDNDGVTYVQELQQSTSDNQADTDQDGIDDLTESEWFINRDDVFCDKTTTPYTCTYPDPLVQDLFVEVDWMNDTSTNILFKPSSTQLGLVEAMFANHDINVHFDIGEYGGGNELADYTSALRYDDVVSTPDFTDYKNGGDGISSNFASNRLNIWHYMIYGNFYSSAAGIDPSSGWGEVIGDDLFIAGGVIENLTGAVSMDRAVANSIAHELGHNLCLSPGRAYFEQGVECIFEGIDNRSGLPPVNDPDAYFNLENYESVMNYRYQLTDNDDIGVVDYSNGPNSSTDHDDWSAVKNHLGAFTKSRTLYIEYGAKNIGQVKSEPLSGDGVIIASSR